MREATIRPAGLSGVLLSALTLLAAGCAPAATAVGPPATLRVGLALTADGPGDLAANDTALSGVDRARKNIDIKVESSIARPDETQAARERRLRDLAAGGDHAVIAIGPSYAEPVRRVARHFPRTRFLMVDPDDCAAMGSNVQVTCFGDEQGAVLVGAAAALKSRSGVLAFLGDRAAGDRLWRGFHTGATAMRPRIEIVRPPGPPDAGAAQAAFERGADVALVAAGRRTVDIARIAVRAEALIVGVGPDLYHHPELADVRSAILTSMLRRIDLSVGLFLTHSARGSFSPTVDRYGLVNGGVDYSRSSGRVENVLDRLEALQIALVDNRIRVPDARRLYEK